MFPAKSYFFKFTFLFFFIQNVFCDSVFETKPVQVDTFENETVMLPCYIGDNQGIRVRWYKHRSLLGDSQDAHHLLPPRFRMHANFSLQIDGLTANDTGLYTCEIVRSEPWEPVKQTHSIRVLYAPKLRTIPANGFLEVKKGEYIDFGCEVTGEPKPIIDWKKNGETMALLEHRSRIRFKAENRLLAGLYECVVNNGVGGPITGSIRVIIQDAPVAYALDSFVHTAEGLRAVLKAQLEYNNPPARTNWYKDGRPVKTDDRVVVMVIDNVHQLIFRSVRKSDLGNYTFRAENKLGMADLSFKLSGVPNTASFKVDQHLNRPSATSFTLIWEVDSYSTIIEYNLWIRPYYGHLTHTDAESFTTESPANRWSKIVVPGDSTDGPIHSTRYTVRGLTPSTVYEAIITSRNKFGWSKPSAILHFATEPGISRRPSTSDYSETPNLEDFIETERNYNTSQINLSERVHTDSAARETPSLFTFVLFLFVMKMLSCICSD